MHRQQQSASSTWNVAAGSGGGSMDTQSKYARYTSEQLEVLEQVYNDCPKPSALRRQQLVREAAVLANIAPKQLKVWFQNRRCREKQRKETTRLHGLNAKLTALNKILVENNDQLTKQSIQLITQKHLLRKHLYGECGQTPLLQLGASGAGTSEPPGTLPNFQRLSLEHHTPTELMAIAEEALNDFIAKATGTSVDWIQLLGMKPGPDSFGILAISHGCDGVAARALGLVALEATKIVEVLKDRSSWLWDCRRSDVLQIHSIENGGTLEVVHTQLYAPTTLAPPRDFCTLRFTTSLDDGNLVVCECSVSDGQGGVPPVQCFTRAKMLTSGYLVRPCDGGNCIVYIIDHFNLEPSSVSEVIRPLYRSSSLLAQRVTLKSLRYLKHLAQEDAGEITPGNGQQPAVLRSLSRRMARGFNDAINGFAEDGWCSMGNDGLDNVALSFNETVNFHSGRLASLAGALCAKVSMLLQNVHPSSLIRFLRDHRSEWGGCSFDPFQGGFYKGHDKRHTHVPLFHTTKEDFLEAVILEGHFAAEDGSLVSRELYLLQLCSGVEDDAIGGSAQLIFAPVDANLSEDMPLLSSGFRALPLCDNMDEQIFCEAGRSDKSRDQRPSRSILTMAFQFMYEVGTQPTVAELARNYIRHVTSFVQRVAVSLSSSAAAPTSVLPSMVQHQAWLIHRLLHSYSVKLGSELFSCDVDEDDKEAVMFWHYAAAILCCSLRATPEFVLANQAGLQMLEVTPEELASVSWQRTLGFGLNAALAEEYCHLGEDKVLSSKGRRVQYKRGIAWKVHDVHAGEVEYVAFMFIGWSFDTT